jgi:hypothetical protein
VFLSPGSHQITDLMPVEPEIGVQATTLSLKATIATPLGPIVKTWSVDAASHTLQL